MSLIRPLKIVTTVRIVTWRSSSEREPAESTRLPISAAAPVRSMAAARTNIDAIIATAGLPKPDSAARRSRTERNPPSPSGCQGTTSASSTSKAATSIRTCQR